MSSLSRRPNGHKWIFYRFDGKRHTLRLGKVDDKLAEEVQRRLDRLVEYLSHGVEPDAETFAWRLRLSERVYKSLVTAGLAKPRGPTTIGDLLAAHATSLAARGVKPSTLTNNRVLHDNLRDFFTAERRLSAICTQDADAFRLHLAAKGGKDGKPLAKSTVSNRCRRARGVFALAVRSGWLASNPFQFIPTGKEWNDARNRYILPEVFEKILGMTTDHELRLLLALVRYCGLRCPSEIKPLHWAAVDWSGNVLVVHSPKNDEHASGRREVPLFETVMPYLLAAAEHRGESPLMFPKHQTTGQAITGRLAVLCRKAGEVLWPKPFVNMRASAERDAMQAGHQFDKVAQWFGHSPAIAIRHYSRVVKEREARSASGGQPRSQPEALSDCPRASGPDVIGRFGA